jgi:hypothetical protein
MIPQELTAPGQVTVEPWKGPVGSPQDQWRSSDPDLGEARSCSPVEQAALDFGCVDWFMYRTGSPDSGQSSATSTTKGTTYLAGAQTLDRLA